MNFRLRSYTSTAASHDASTVTSPGDCGYEVIASTIVAAFPSSMSTIFKYHVFNFHAVTALPYIVTTFKIWLSWNERTIIALCLATLQESKATATALFYVCLQCEKPKINKGLNLQIVIIYRVQLDLLPPFVLCSPLCPCFAAARPWLPWISCGAEQGTSKCRVYERWAWWETQWRRAFGTTPNPHAVFCAWQCVGCPWACHRLPCSFPSIWVIA
jgi:hypothetical protein